MSFVKFESVGAKLSNTISLNKSESIGFASGFMKKYNLTDFRYVSLFFDKEGEEKIGFQFSKEKSGKSSFTLIYSENRQSASAVCRSFFRTFGIEVKKYQGKYEPVEFTDPQHGKIFYIVLSKTENK